MAEQKKKGGRKRKADVIDVGDKPAQESAEEAGDGGDEEEKEEPEEGLDADLVAAGGRSPHANVTFHGRADSGVKGTVFEVTGAELAAADEYEKPAAYERTAVRLASGRQAWVYAHKGHGG